MGLVFRVSLLFLLTPLSWGQGEELHPLLWGIHCREQVVKSLKSLNSKNDWSRGLSSNPKEIVLYSPTKNFGFWIELRKSDSPEILLHSSKEIKILQWDSKKCELVKNSTFPSRKYLGARSPAFTDQKLEGLMKNEEVSLVGIFPTEDVYATYFKKWKELKKESNIKGHEVFIHVKNKAFMRLKSLELKMRGNLSTSYPVFFLVGNNRISAPLLGDPETEAFRNRFNQRLSYMEMNHRFENNEMHPTWP